MSIKVKIVWIYYLLIAQIIITLPSFVYAYGDANFHWLCHLMSLTVSRVCFGAFLIYILYENNISITEHFGVVAAVFLFFMFIPIYLGDLRYVDKYDIFTRPARLIVTMITALIIGRKLTKDLQ